ncbi:MAG: hypothetical protein JXR76_02650 [Deltaproteobacteria bacterium]|nr:hypothetical protein [Deltaproteobacteria bacterium]
MKQQLITMCVLVLLPAVGLAAPNYDIRKLSDDVYHYPHNTFQLNDLGHVVWEGRINDDPGAIYLFNGSGIETISTKTYNHNPRINARDEIVWLGWDEAEREWEVFLFDGVTVSQLTTNTQNDYYAQINDNGWVVWAGYDGNDYEIYLYDGLSTRPITQNNVYDVEPQLNNSGQIVWSHGYAINSEYEIPTLTLEKIKFRNFNGLQVHV